MAECSPGSSTSRPNRPPQGAQHLALWSSGRVRSTRPSGHQDGCAAPGPLVIRTGAQHPALWSSGRVRSTWPSGHQDGCAAPGPLVMRTEEESMPNRPLVFATRALPSDALSGLAGACELEVWQERRAPTREALAAHAAEADGLVCLLTDRIDARLLARCPRLRAVSSVSVGVDHVDLAAATARRIPIGHTPGVLTETTADLAFALMLAAARRVAEGDRWVRAGEWRPDSVWEPDRLLGRDVHCATLGIVGLGAIGRAVARRARGFAMRVLAFSRGGRVPADLP